MLFPPNPAFPLSAIFSGLYALMQEVLHASCVGQAVRPAAMPAGLWVAVQANHPSRDELAAFDTAIRALSETERHQLALSTRSAPSVRELFCDSTKTIPLPPTQLIGPLKSLVKHLFDRTSKLISVEAACGESLHDYCTRYASARSLGGNGNICNVCGTEVLAQPRHGVASDDQWRAAIDHLLAEARYPLIALDPGNLLPVCYHCNSRAKLAKDLLHDEYGARRICFDPWTECAHGQVHVSVNLTALAPEADVTFTPANPTQGQKLSTWDAVYEVSSRVNAVFSSLAVILSRDLDLDELLQFRRSVARKARICSDLARAEPNNYWRGLLYQGMAGLTDEQLEQLRVPCKQRLDGASSGFADVFGI